MSVEKINVLIVEDESIVALDLAAGLEKDGYNVAGIADNSVEANEIFRDNDVDIILMDVNILGDKDGIDTAAELLQIKQVPVIYLTAFTDEKTVGRVKQSHAAAFLTKPYNINNVRIAIDLAISNFSIVKEQKSSAADNINKNLVKEEQSTDKEVFLQMNDSIFIKQNNKFIKVLLKEILYIEADNNYIHVACTGRKYILRISLQHFKDKLQYNRFARVHRSFLVNIDAIRSFSETEVQIEDIEIPISRNYRDEFIAQLKVK